MSDDVILYEKRAPLARVHLNRPQVHNALAPESVRALAATWREVARDPEVRVVLLGGAGASFCAGMDLKRTEVGFGWRDGAAEDGWSAGPGERRRIDYVPPADMAKPIVVALHGATLGGGLELALHGDVRIAAEGARFGLPEVSRGLIPGSGGLYWLPRLIGPGRAADLILTGRIVEADEALALGLVDRLVPAAALIEASEEVAAAIARNAPLAVQAAKEGMRRTLGVGLDEAMRVSENLNRVLRLTEDAEEGARAFAERRTPAFRGR